MSKIRLNKKINEKLTKQHLYYTNRLENFIRELLLILGTSEIFKHNSIIKVSFGYNFSFILLFKGIFDILLCLI